MEDLTGVDAICVFLGNGALSVLSHGHNFCFHFLLLYIVAAIFYPMVHFYPLGWRGIVVAWADV